MIKQLTLVLTMLTSAMTVWSQVKVTGTVIAKDDNSPIPGVNVLEKGTQTGTATDTDGTFSLNVSDENSTLVFSFVGFVTQEYPLRGQGHVSIKMKLDCNKDFFDSNRISIYVNSGLINNPIGGQVEIASPYILGGVVKFSYSHQTNLEENKFQNGQIEFAHFISNCDFDMDFKWSHRQVSFDNDLSSKANSFEADLNLRKTKIIAGYSHLDFARIETTESRTASGLLVGLGIYIGKPLYSMVVGKISLYEHNIEYQSYIQSQYKRLCYFIKFYKLDSFNELSLGIGTVVGYRLKKRSNNP